MSEFAQMCFSDKKGQGKHESCNNLWHSPCPYFLKRSMWCLKHICVKVRDYWTTSTIMTLCIVIHLLLFDFLPTSSGLTGLYFGLYKRSETGSVWSSVFTVTCSYKHTPIPHVVVYRPCLYIQRLGFNIYCWAHVVFTVHLSRLTEWFIYVKYRFI